MNLLDLSTTFSADVSPFNNAMNTAAGQADAAFSAISASAKAFLGSSGVCRYFIQAAKAAADFGQTMADISAISDVSIKRIHDNLLRLPNYFGDVSKQAESMYEIISSGFRDLDAEGLDKFQRTVSKSAKVIRADVYATGNAITTLANAYKLNVNQVEKLTDWFYLTVREGKAHGDDLARTLGLVTASASEGGVRLRELGAAIAILSRTQSASQSFIGLNQALNAIIKPTLKAQQAAKKWGIDISAARVQNEGLVPLLQELHDKVGGNVEALEDMFGNIRAGRAILTLTGQQFKDFIGVLHEFDQMAGKGEEAFQKQIDTTKTAIESMETQFHKTSIVIGEDFSTVTKIFAGLAESVASAFAGLDKIDRAVIYITTIRYVLSSIGTAMRAVSNAVTRMASKNIVNSFNSVHGAVTSTNTALNKTQTELGKVNTAEEKRLATIKASVAAEEMLANSVNKTSAAVEKSNMAFQNKNAKVVVPASMPPPVKDLELPGVDFRRTSYNSLTKLRGEHIPFVKLDDSKAVLKRLDTLISTFRKLNYTEKDIRGSSAVQIAALRYAELTGTHDFNVSGIRFSVPNNAMLSSALYSRNKAVLSHIPNWQGVVNPPQPPTTGVQPTPIFSPWVLEQGKSHLFGSHIYKNFTDEFRASSAFHSKWGDALNAEKLATISKTLDQVRIEIQKAQRIGLSPKQIVKDEYVQLAARNYHLASNQSQFKVGQYVFDAERGVNYVQTLKTNVSAFNSSVKATKDTLYGIHAPIKESGSWFKKAGVWVADSSKKAAKGLKNFFTTGSIVTKKMRNWVNMQQTSGSNFGTKYGTGNQRQQAVNQRYMQMYGFLPGTGAFGKMGVGLEKFINGPGGIGAIMSLLQVIGLMKMSWDFGKGIGRAIANKLGTDGKLFQEGLNDVSEREKQIALRRRKQSAGDRVVKAKNISTYSKLSLMNRLNTAYTDEALQPVLDDINAALAGEEKGNDDLRQKRGRIENIKASVSELETQIQDLQKQDIRFTFSPSALKHLPNIIDNNAFNVNDLIKSEAPVETFRNAFLTYVQQRGDAYADKSQQERYQALYEEFLHQLDTQGLREMSAVVHNMPISYLPSAMSELEKTMMLKRPMTPEQVQASASAIPHNKLSIPDAVKKAFDDPNTREDLIRYFITPPDQLDVQKFNQSVQDLLNNEELKPFFTSEDYAGIRNALAERLKIFLDINSKDGEAIKQQALKELNKKLRIAKVKAGAELRVENIQTELDEPNVFERMADVQATNRTMFGMDNSTYYKQQYGLENKKLGDLQSAFSNISAVIRTLTTQLTLAGESQEQIDSAISGYVNKLDNLQQTITKQKDKLDKIRTNIEKSAVDTRLQNIETNQLKIRIANGGASEMSMLRLRKKQIIENMGAQQSAYENVIGANIPSLNKRKQELSEEWQRLRAIPTAAARRRMAEIEKEVSDIGQKIAHPQLIDPEASKNFFEQQSKHKAELAEINKQMRDYRNAFVNQNMQSVQSFASEKDSRGNLTNNALYHSVNLLSRIAPVFAQQMSSAISIGGISTGTSFNTNRAVDAQRAVADALDTYIIDQRYANDQMGTNVAKILDTMNMRQPVFLN